LGVADPGTQALIVLIIMQLFGGSEESSLDQFSFDRVTIDLMPHHSWL
jgi:hypothetical protein